MNIRIVCVGKIKESYFRGAVDEYARRLSRYCRLSITECQDEKTPDGASAETERAIRQTEGVRILRHIKDGDYCIALAIKGRKLDSEHLSAHLERLMGTGRSTIVFVIGGSLGLSEEVLRRADEEISFSDLTFPHQLMRVILLEQIYRSFRIIKNEPYHK